MRTEFKVSLILPAKARVKDARLFILSSIYDCINAERGPLRELNLTTVRVTYKKGPYKEGIKRVRKHTAQTNTDTSQRSDLYTAKGELNMSFSDLNLASEPAAELVPDGTEVQVHVKSANGEAKSKQKGTPNLELILEVVDYPNVDNIFLNLYYPQDSTSPKGRRFMMSKIREACDGFGVAYPESGGRDSDFLEKNAWVIMGIETDPEGQREPKNVIKKFSRSAAAVAH